MDLLNTLGGDAAQPGPQTPQCSRKDCRLDALWQVLWNNPKVHAPERRKIWLACDVHRAWLENYLAQRLFWRSTEPLDAGPATSTSASPAGETVSNTVDEPQRGDS